MSLQFVNIHGEKLAVAVGIKPKAAKGTKKAKAEDEGYHKGFRVMGFSPAHLEKARTEWNAKRAERLSPTGDQVDIGEFIVDSFVTIAKPKAVRREPYAILDAAQQCAELAKRSGWVGVTVVPIVKAKETTGGAS